MLVNAGRGYGSSRRSGTSSTLLEPVAWSCLDSSPQGCVADFDGHGWLLGFRGAGKSEANQQNPQRDGTVESHPCRFRVF